MKKGVIIVPVFYEDDDFKAEILKFPEITATLEKYANFYLEKLLKNSVGVDDIILCLESIPVSYTHLYCLKQILPIYIRIVSDTTK